VGLRVHPANQERLNRHDERRHHVKNVTILALLREIERIHPSPDWSRRNHGITWQEPDVLVLFINRGDSLQMVEINPADLSDDPAETAALLISRCEIDNNPAQHI
jgi:hypothetical protein